MPLPDESSRPKASDLIRRFQQQVDSTQEAPLVPSSSFATPGKPRVSLSGPSVPPKLSETGAAAPRAVKAKEEPVEEPEQRPVKEEQVEKPTLAVSTHPESLSSALPLQTTSPSSTTSSPTFSRPAYAHHSHQASLPPIITAPSPPSSPPIAVPGSTLLLASPQPSPGHSRNASFDSLPPSPGGTREGLSQPSSLMAESGRLSAPPVRDDSSPPPPGPLFPSRELQEEPESPTRLAAAFSAGPMTAPDSPSPSASPEPPAKDLASLSLSSPSPPPASSPSAQKARQQAASPTLSTPTASFLAKIRPPRASGGSPSTSPSRARTATASSAIKTTGPTSARMSPSNSRGSATSARSASVVSPAPSATSASSARGSSPSAIRTPKSSISLPTAKSKVPTTGTPRSRKAAAEAAAASASPSTSPATSKKASPTTIRKTTSTSPEASRSSGVPPPSSATGRGGQPLRMARRGRIGLAGAGATKRSALADNKERKEAEKPAHEVATGASEPDSAANGDDIPSIPSDDDDEARPPDADSRSDDAGSEPSGEKVFAGFGAHRPHGRIPIPMQEGGERAVGAGEVDEAVRREAAS